jgi:hypothetical protein
MEIDCEEYQVVISSPNLNIGKMQYLGPFNSMTFSGLNVDVVKSALQKYIRRNVEEKAVLAGFELYRMSVLHESFRTNLYHRLAIIAAEDIGPANIGLVIFTIQLVLAKNRNPEMLGALIQSLAKSPKTRVMSHLHWGLVDCKGRKKAKSLGVQIDELASEEDLSSKEVQWDPRDPQKLRIYLEIFRRRLMTGSLSALIWLHYYALASKDIKIYPRNIRPRRRQTNPMIAIWEVLKEFLPPAVWEALIDCYLSISENMPFLMCAIVCILYNVEYRPFDITQLYGAWVNEESASHILAGNYILEVDDYVIDRHTRRGRLNGKNMKDFVTEGSKISPEDQRFVTPIFKTVYESLR